MSKVSIAELRTICESKGITDYVYVSHRQDITKEYDPIAFSLHFGKVEFLEADGIIYFENEKADDTMVVMDIKEVHVHESRHCNGLKICIKCCSNANNSRTKTCKIFAK